MVIDWSDGYSHINRAMLSKFRSDENEFILVKNSFPSSKNCKKLVRGMQPHAVALFVTVF